MHNFFDESTRSLNHQQGFTLIELFIVVAVIAILAAIALPSYNDYVIRTNRVDMMTELQSIAQRIEAQKIVHGGYSKIALNDILTGSVDSNGNVDYPIDNPLYTINVTPVNAAKTKLSGGDWELTAVPKPDGKMADDGNLTLNSRGVKCHNDTNCGMGDSWRN